ELAPGEHFVIGETIFTLVDEPTESDHSSQRAVEEQTFSAQYLRGLRYHNADQRIEVLSRLPELISGALADDEFFARLAALLLAGMPRASLVALVAWNHEEGEHSSVRVLHSERRRGFGGDFRPSQRLVAAA